MTDYTIVRDYWDRPFVTQDGGPLQYVEGRRTPINAEAYTRISTLAGALDDKSGLIDWTAARAMIGTVKSNSIHARVAHLISAHDDPWSVPEGKKPLKELVEKAKELGGTDDAADLGTAFHGLTECLDRGASPAYVPRYLEAWLQAYAEAMEDWEPVLVEPFVVCDPIKSAGSPDRYLRHKPTGVVYCADIKSGSSEPDYPMKVTTQVAIGAHAQQYCQETGSRTAIQCSKERGVLIHAPIRGDNPRVELYWLDLAKGWELAQLAYTVREARKMSKLERIQ